MSCVPLNFHTLPSNMIARRRRKLNYFNSSIFFSTLFLFFFLRICWKNSFSLKFVLFFIILVFPFFYTLNSLFRKFFYLIFSITTNFSVGILFFYHSIFVIYLGFLLRFFPSYLWKGIIYSFCFVRQVFSIFLWCSLLFTFILVFWFICGLCYFYFLISMFF